MIQIRLVEEGATCLSGRKTACGVVCLDCLWVGVRRVMFIVGVTADTRFNVALATSSIKGRDSTPDCPKCNSSCVIFTHARRGQ